MPEAASFVGFTFSTWRRHSQAASIIAEGIEHPEELAGTGKNGRGLGAGYWLGRPEKVSQHPVRNHASAHLANRRARMPTLETVAGH